MLLLGASGFIGRWVARALSDAGADLVAVVRNPGAASQVVEPMGVRGALIQADLGSENAIGDLCGSVRPAITFNLVGYGVHPAERDESAARALNVTLVERLARAAAETSDPDWPGSQLVHVGSALEYGHVAGGLTEDTAPNPTTVYGRSKLNGTEALRRVCDESNLRGLTARLFMVYGAGEHETRLLPLLIKTAREGSELALTSGVQCRDFTYVEDVADGLLRLGLVRTTAGSVVNLATGRMTSVAAVVRAAAQELHIPEERLRFGALPSRDDEMTQVTGVSIDRLRALTGWAPETAVADGLRRAIAWTGRLSKTVIDPLSDRR